MISPGALQVHGFTEPIELQGSRGSLLFMLLLLNQPHLKFISSELSCIVREKVRIHTSWVDVSCHPPATSPAGQLGSQESEGQPLSVCSLSLT